MKQPQPLKILFILAIGMVLLIVAGSAPFVRAAPKDISGSVTQSYNAEPNVVSGMIVALKAKDQATVEPARLSKEESMVGVVIPVNDAPIVLTPEAAAARQVLVASSDRHVVLVSNQNGAIKKGDYLTVSALDGIGMKASEVDQQVIGRAAGNFDGKNNVIGSTSVKGSLGDRTVAIGHIPVDVRLGSNPLLQKPNNLPAFLTRTATNITHKPVGNGRIYISLFALLATFYLTGSVLYGAVRSGIIASGRNPLARKAILRSLVQSMAAGLVIFAAGLFAIYLILNL